MALNIKNAKVERLAGEGAIRLAMVERRARFLGRATRQP